ncbi:MAG: hypothetical protein H0U74_00190 [Bradymonadaceae bacterium]|nr:hypothetical protein [Lujinxingiaceae bacterium]
MIYDDTCRGRGLRPGLTHSWVSGALMYRALGWLDLAQGATSWEQALGWLASVEPTREISEIQFWGHGKWGQAMIDRNVLDAGALEPSHTLHTHLAAIRERLVGPHALWWFRTCETFGAEAGHDFAQRWTSFFNCRAAGHTFIIGPLQSGLHCLAPGERPNWPLTEGLAKGTPAQPLEALWSSSKAPNTITCLQSRLP